MKKILPIEIDGAFYSKSDIESLSYNQFHQLVGFIEKESKLYKLRGWRQHCPKSLIYLDNLLMKL